MLVKESISFERYRDPKESLKLGKQASKEYVYEKLEKEGANFSFYGSEENQKHQKQNIIDNIFEIEKTLNKCKGIIPIREISSDDGKIDFRPGDLYKVMNRNNTLFACASEKDAIFITKILSKLVIDRYPKESFKVEFESSSLQYPYLPSYTLNELVDNIIEMRQKFENFI
jgi:hypothetical protein